jgi:hypothetical protein
MERGQELYDQRHRVQDVLAIVEHEQCGMTFVAGAAHPSWQIRRGDIRQSQGFRNRGRNEGGITNGGEFNECNAACPTLGDGTCNFQRQAGLSNSAGADQRNQAGMTIV